MSFRSRRSTSLGLISISLAASLAAGCSYLSNIKLPDLPSSAPVTVEVRQPTITPAPAQPTLVAPPTATVLPQQPATQPTVAAVPTSAPVPTVVPEPVVPTNASWALTSDQAILFENRTVKGGETYEGVAEIGEATQAAFTVYSLREVQFKVIAPNGQVIDPAFVSAYPNYGTLNASAGTPNGTDGRTYQYIINAPQEGTWKLSISAESTTPIGMVASVSSPMMLRFNFDQRSYKPADGARIETSIEYRGVTIKRGTTLSAAVLLPDGNRRPIDVQDNRRNGDAKARDGVFTGQFDIPANISVDQPFVQLELVGTFKGSTRKVYVTLPVVPAGASIGEVQESTVDSDRDSLIDSLALTITLNVARSGNYGLKGTLVAANGTEVGSAIFSSSQNKQALETGKNDIILMFEGRAIRQLALAGPYKLNLNLFDENNANTEIVRADGMYATQAYNLENFESPNLKVEAGKEQTADTNGNGKFDALRISLPLSFVNKGEYRWEAKLVDSSGNLIEVVSGSGPLDTNTPLALDFSGKKIRIGKQNGPYTIANLLISQISGPGAGSGSDLFQNVYTTKPYKSAQFESAGL